MKRQQVSAKNPKWHLETAEWVLDFLKSSEAGLSFDEAEKRLKENGPNKLPEEKSFSIFRIFIEQFRSPLIYVLLLSALTVSFIGEKTDGLIIVIVLFLNAMIGSFQEGRARKTLKSLKDFSKGTAVVLRGGNEMEINEENLVRGDILVLRSGDKIPADGRIIQNQSMKINESALTGESEPVDKEEQVLNEDLEVPDRKNLVYKGSLLVAGSGRAVVVAVGTDTLIGGIAEKLKTLKEDEVPLKKKIKTLSKIIGLAALGAALFVVIVGLIRGLEIKELFFAAVAISVSLIPEGLPVVMTLVLAKGVYRMARRNALIKNMQAVEALGQASVLAVDKTGTITKNELMVERVFVDGREFKVSGGGYEPSGDIFFENNAIDPLNHPELLFAGKIATFCADASVEVVGEEKRREIKVIGDPTEAALLVFGRKTGFKKEELEREEPKFFEIPFNFKNRFHVTMHQMSEIFLTTLIGAPEVILERVSCLWTSGGQREILKEDFNLINEKIEEFSKKGLRVICFAVRESKDSAFDSEEIKNLCFGGIFAIADVLREEVAEAVRSASENGVRTVMITGDHLETAKSIGKEAGIFSDGDGVLLGADMQKMSDDDLSNVLGRVSVFARVLPEHKMTIVEAYKKKGDVIGMTGDGVNDALSLSAADLGIAMGQGGTEVAKEAADIVLLDNNFKSILAAIEEGRAIYATIKKVVLYLVSTSIGEFLTIAGALVLGLPLPISPSQILWLNLVTDGFLVIALAFEKSDQRSRRNQSAIIDKKAALRALVMGAVMMIGSISVFYFAYMSGRDTVWTLSLSVLAVFQWFNAWNCRSETSSVFEKPFSNPYLLLGVLSTILLQIFAIYNPLMQKILNTMPISANEWFIVVGTAFSIIIVEEIRKLFVRRKEKYNV